MRGSCLAINKSLITNSSVDHSSSLKQVKILYPLVQSLLFPTSSSLPHIFFVSCCFKLFFSLRAYHRKKPEMPFLCLSYTDQSSSKSSLPQFFFELAFWVASGISVSGINVHLLMLLDDAQTWEEQYLMLCRNKAATKTEELFSQVITHSSPLLTFATKSGETKAYA